MYTKVLILMQGVSGSGKTTWVNQLVERVKSTSAGIVVCSADDYWGDPYCFDPSKLPLAHEQCQQRCVEAMVRNVPYVVIDNTNIDGRGLQFYLDVARKYGYGVYVKRITVEFHIAKARNNSRPVNRRVPDHIMQRQFSNMTELSIPEWQ